MEPFELAKHADGAGLLELSTWSRRFPEVTAGFTTRHGGISEAPFGTLNCGLHVADKAEDVVRNRELAARAVGIGLDAWTYGEQVHGSRVAVVTGSDRGKGTLSRESELHNTDAFITREAGICLAALFADCVPLYFYDPIHRAIGLAHAGWKGTVLRIAEITVQAMGDSFGCKPEDLYAAIGPSIGVCCYEVDETVIDRVRELGMPGQLFTETGEGKYKLNLQECNRQIMIKAGILPTRIEITNWCTSCRTDMFFSHRKEYGRTGRMIAWLGMRERAGG